MNAAHPVRLGILGSGQGSNFVAVADAIAAGAVPAEVAVVLSDVADAGILARARERGLPAEYIAPGPFRTKLDEPAEAAFVRALQQARVDRLLFGSDLEDLPMAWGLGPILFARLSPQDKRHILGGNLQRILASYSLQP